MIVKPLFSPNFGLLFHKTNSNKLLSNISFPNQSSIIYIYITRDPMQENMRFCYMAHSMKRIEMILSHIRDKNKFKNRDSLFFWFNISRPLFVTFFIQCLKDYYLFHLVKYLRLFLFFTHTKLFAFPFTFSILLFYIHMPIALHTIQSQIHLDKKKKKMSITFNLSTTSTYLQHCDNI